VAASRATYALFGTKGSGSAAVEAASWEPGPGRDELQRVNPLCQIPTLLLPDGSVLTESAAILIHLGLAHPASGLLPADAARRAQVLRGLVYVAANCYAAIGVIDYPERWCSDADEDTRKRIKAGSMERLHYLWEVFADTFSAQPFLTGERPGALDLLAAVVSKWSGSRKHLAASRPAFSALLTKIEGDPRVAPVFLRHWPPSA
jgi:GST-like protein